MTAVDTDDDVVGQRHLRDVLRMPTLEAEPLWRILAGGPAVVVLLAVAGLISSFMVSRHAVELGGASVLAIAAGVGYGFAAVRKVRRQELVKLVIGRLMLITGPVQLRVARWSGEGVGHPRRLRLVYGPGAPASDEAFESSVTKVIGEVLGATYVVHRHRPKHATMLLRAVQVREPEPRPEPPAKPDSQVRAESLLSTMIPGSRLDLVEISDEGEVTRIEGSHDLGAKLAAEGYQRRVENTFSRCMPGRWRCRWDTITDRFAFEVRPTFPDLVRMPPLARVDIDARASYRDTIFWLGEDEDGERVGWHPATYPHGVVVGETGSGKTVLMRSAAQQAAHAGWQVFVLDGKGVEFLGLRDWPNVTLVATKVEEQVALLMRVKELMEERYALVESGRARREDFEPILFEVDEFADFRGNLRAWYSVNKPKGAPSVPPALDALWSLLRKGRTAEIHLLIGVQRPDQEYFAGDARDNIGFRASLGRLKVDGARMMWESSAIGTSIPRGKKGRGTCLGMNGHPVEFQAYYNPDPYEIDPGSPEFGELEQFRPVRTRHHRMVIIPPEPLVDLDDEGADEWEPGYFDYINAEWGWASDHPDLDPVQIAASARRVDGAWEASAANVFGLSKRDTPAPSPADSAPVSLVKPEDATEPCPPVSARPALQLVPSAGMDSGKDDADLVDDDAEEALDGYYEPRWISPTEVGVGWLIRPDDDVDAWAVVEDTGPHPSDTSLTAIAWRDDDDADGDLCLSDDQTVYACEPMEDA